MYMLYRLHNAEAIQKIKMIFIPRKNFMALCATKPLSKEGTMLHCVQISLIRSIVEYESKFCVAYFLPKMFSETYFSSQITPDRMCDFSMSLHSK